MLSEVSGRVSDEDRDESVSGNLLLNNGAFVQRECWVHESIAQGVVI